MSYKVAQLLSFFLKKRIIHPDPSSPKRPAKALRTSLLFVHRGSKFPSFYTHCGCVSVTCMNEYRTSFTLRMNLSISCYNGHIWGWPLGWWGSSSLRDLATSRAQVRQLSLRLLHSNYLTNSLSLTGNKVKNNHINKSKTFSSGWCGSVDWVLACKPKSRWFDSQSGHLAGLRGTFPVGRTWEATTH